MAELRLDSHLTSHEVAKLLQVNATSLIQWSKKGHVRCHVTPGGHRRFIVADVIAFVKKQGMPMPRALAEVRQ